MISLTFKKEFQDFIISTQEQEKQIKMKASADYVEYIKEHDKEAYKKYLSYSTYLKCI
ncbi:MAG: hypothetical protein Q9M32_06440 [Sulfurimonas sp.]|nr:hypothetical protein [Sulfurimonas sp.]MDQ7062378.1 hypothetical protein [Sulfurimonas sp.]